MQSRTDAQALLLSRTRSLAQAQAPPQAKPQTQGLSQEQVQSRTDAQALSLPHMRSLARALAQASAQ